MALLRAELKGAGRTLCQKQAGAQPRSETLGVYEGIVETTSDLSLPRLATFDPGSMLYCMSNNSIYVKTSQGNWTALNT